MFDLIGGATASFVYNGEKITLDPAGMRETASGTYEKTLPDGLTAILELASPAENARTQHLRFEHRGNENSGAISFPCALDAAAALPGSAVYESLQGDNCSGESFLARTETLGPGDRFEAEPRFGRPADTTAFPFFDLAGETGAATFGIGWSGQWRLELEKTDAALHIRAGLPDVETFLSPGEAVRTALVLWVTAADVPAARRAFRRVMLNHFSPRDPETGGYVRLPIAEQNFDRYVGKRDDWATMEGQRRCADIAADCGMDTLWLDAAWFKDGFPGGVGNYDYAPGFPNGTGEVSAYAHKKVS